VSQTPDELAFADLGTKTMLANVESWDEEPVTEA
jgi:hypothetical protein